MVGIVVAAVSVADSQGMLRTGAERLQEVSRAAGPARVVGGGGGCCRRVVSPPPDYVVSPFQRFDGARARAAGRSVCPDRRVGKGRREGAVDVADVDSVRARARDLLSWQASCDAGWPSASV
jgi:hypothetical protein